MKMKEFADRVNRANKKARQVPSNTNLAAGQSTRHTARQRALQYSKLIPKPNPLKLKAKSEKEVLTDLERLERDHVLHKERMKAIAAELLNRERNMRHS